MAEIRIETLVAKEGNKPGEAVATLGRRSIVFLPRGVTSGQEVRVELHEIREDSRGNMMYRGIPAPDVMGEIWKDNGDGTASRFITYTDWQGAVHEGVKEETRTLLKREVEAWGRTDQFVEWGNNQTSTVMKKVEVKRVSLQAEQVQNGQVAWAETGTREEPGNPELSPITQVKVWAGDLDAHKLELVYKDSWSLTADCYYSASDYVRVNTEWGKLPTWLQAQVLAQYPSCSCGRARVDSKNSDNYTRCECCRKEENCIRCGQRETVKNFAGRLICAKCEPYETQEVLIQQHLPANKRQTLADQAVMLLLGEAYPREAGEMILRNTVDHIEREYDRNRLIEKISGYGWYYFSDEGVYGSKFSPSALQVLQYLSQSQGNGLVELVAWLCGQQKVEECEWNGDYYQFTQVKGESRTPSLTESSVSQATVATRLRGTEADRQTALGLCRQLQDASDTKIQSAVRDAKDILNGSQDYLAAITILQATITAVVNKNKPVSGERLVDAKTALLAKFGKKR